MIHIFAPPYSNQIEADIAYLIKEIEKGGAVTITNYKQGNGPYISISGLGVMAGGYKTFEQALRNWREARER